MMRRRFAMAATALLLSAVPALAQTAGASSSDGELRGRLFIHFEGQAVKAKDSFDVVTGSSTVTGLGIGLELQNVWRSLFIRVGTSKLTASGERVFVDDGEVFPLGIPIDITMKPIEVAAGWRFKPLGSGGITPYAGLGPMFLKYREESEGDISGETFDATYAGIALFGGIEVPVWKKISAGAELGLRRATVDSPRGTMRIFGENDLGGLTFRVMVSFRN
jgi:hypothetical protein